ncbi:MAG: outer membrane beta-barrel protein [Rhizobacter sp.]|nr:outer membrane beta-barrel protein [Ferruginibacter sp.]
MPKSIALFICCLFVCICTKAQQTNLSGTIKDTTSGNLVKNAVVVILSPKDSVLVGFARTKDNGSYNLPNIPAGKYILMVMHPTFADYVDDIEIKDTDTKVPLVAVTPKSKLLEAVIVKAGGSMRIKGDTTIYTADSFKVSANANVEELLKKMPGIQVDKNGEIKAMGEVVEKVLVDGEEFFGDDPGMAVKNLRADAIKEVQVFKKKSDQAEFTGIDDGQSKQTINLKLKEDKKKGYFGKIEASAGPLTGDLKDEDHRYNTNSMFSSFKGKRKLSAFLLNGNTGQDGLSWQDMEKYGSNDMNMEMTDDGGMMFFSGGGQNADDEPYVNTENGFINNLNAGLQYSNKFNDSRNTLNLSPKYNSQLYDNTQQVYTENNGGGETLVTNKLRTSDINRQNVKISGSYDMKLDSAANNTLKFTVKSNFYHTESDEAEVSNTYGKENGENKNNVDQRIQKEIDKKSLNLTALYKHKFKKNRRTLSLNADWYTLSTDAENYLDRTTEFFSDGVYTGSQVIDQLSTSDKQTNRWSGKVIYTEPLNKKFSLELSHEISANTGKNEQNTFDFNPGSQKFDLLVDTLTNNFDQTIITNKPGAKISFNSKKIKYNFGTGVGFTNFDLKNLSLDTTYQRNFTNFFPAANFTYTYKSNHSLNINYNGRTVQPTINQLQPLRNNFDPLNIYEGNPGLEQSFRHTLSINHNGYNFIKDRWSYQGLSVNLTENAITNERIINLDSGITRSRPTNTNGNISMNFWGGLGMKIKKLDLRLNFSPNLNYNRFADVINGQTVFTNTTAAGMSVSLQKSKDKKYDVSIWNNFRYNYNRGKQFNYFSQKIETNVRNFSTNQLNVEGTVYYKKVWSIQTDYSFFYNQAASEDEQNIKYSIWNARLQRTFKNNEFTAFVMVRDILNENIGISQTFYGTQFTREINDRLKRYAMLGFRWDFKNKAPKAKETPPAATAEEIK